MEIKKFNDFLNERLSPDTYRSAAKELEKQHKVRSEELYKHARIYKGKETDPYTFLVNDGKDAGKTFSAYFEGFSLYDRAGDISRAHNKYVIDQVLKSGGYHSKSDKWIMDIHPIFIVTEESVQKMRSFDNTNLRNTYRDNNISPFEIRIVTFLDINDEGFVDFMTDGLESYPGSTKYSKLETSAYSQKFLFNNRKDARRFKDHLVNELKPGGQIYEDLNQIVFYDLYEEGQFVPSSVEILSKKVKEKLSLNILYETN